MLCSVSRASAGLTTEYLIVSSQPPTGYYVDGVTACPVSRASAGFTEYLIVSNLECKGESERRRTFHRISDRVESRVQGRIRAPSL